ncbi:MAG: DUF2924 domain-containing protein [Planctomycetes bacterium]|nr:DUF2924 domain-containing protein [Planctomycetota bacterium]
MTSNTTKPDRRPIADEIAELRALSAAALADRYEQVYGKPPRIKHKEYLWKRIAWKIQEQRFGGLSGAAQKRLEELIAEIDIPLGEQTRSVVGKLRPSTRAASGLAIGTTLVREWNGERIEVLVAADGFEFRGERYSSLSAIARKVSGTHWNGPLFFKLRKRAKK